MVYTHIVVSPSHAYLHVVSQGASHRVSTTDEKDPIRFRHMIPTDDLQLRNHSSKLLFCFRFQIHS